MLRSIASRGASLFRKPSKPASSTAAIAKYGLAAGSTLRTSSRVDSPRELGTRINGDRLEPDQAT